MENSCVHVYYGNGKGKTTASLGLCLRCSGRGGKVLFTSFLKSFDSGEFFHELPFDVVKNCRMEGFWCDLSDEKKDEVREKSKKLLCELFARAKKENYDLLVLDEVLNAVETGCVDESLLIDLIKNKPDKTEIVLTGYTVTEKIIALANYVTNVKCEKHPYENGVAAREGIEY